MQNSDDGTAAQTSFEFKPLTPEFDRNPHPAWEHLRRTAPVYWWPAGNAWVLTRHQDISSALRDSRLTTNLAQDGTAFPVLAGLENHPMFILARYSLGFASEVDHARLRRLVQPAFSPASIERMREQIQSIVDGFLDDLGDASHTEIGTQLAEPLPVAVMSGILGLPQEDSALFKRFANAVVVLVSISTSGQLEHEAFMRAADAIAEGYTCLSKLIEHRRKHLGTDLLSALIGLEGQNERLTSDELISMLATLVAGGIESTRHIICFAVLDLLNHPDQAKLIVDDPSLTRSAVEESLRYNWEGKMTRPRFAREDFEIRSTQIRKSDNVLMALGAALRDPDVFANPDVFDIKRDNSRSIPFGVGAHFCLGAPLARIEAEIAVGTLFRRFPGMQLDGEPTFLGSHVASRTMTSLRVKLRPGARD